MNNNFTKDEIVEFERYNKKLKKNVTTKFPVVGGRLRLYHEDLAQEKYSDVASGIDIEIVKYENDVAVIKARVCINGNAFTGVGMSSKSRDGLIYPAILEMAETRAIARALRFAGYGVEYTGAEEMQSVKNFSDDTTPGPDVNVEQKQTINDSETVVDNEQDQEVNDDPDAETPTSMKRRVWEHVVFHFAEVSKELLAKHMKTFVAKAAAKYEEDGDSRVYDAILNHPDLFDNAFRTHLNAELPPITSPGALPEVDSEKLKHLEDEAVEKMTVDPPPPPTDKDKIKKASIYRAMPDGINVSALNGTLNTLVTENEGRAPGDIYDIVLGDIDGFVVLLKEWCVKNEEPSGLEPKVATKEEALPKKKGTMTLKEFRKSWVRLDWENFNKFIIVNSDSFKNNRDEYNAAVSKYDRLKAKSGAPDMVFPYVFSQDQVETVKKPELSIKNSVIESEENIKNNYFKMYPDLAGKIVDSDAGLTTEAFNKQVETMISAWENENKQTYTEG